MAIVLGTIFIAQSYSLAHATKHNDAKHEHNGIACEIMLVSAEDMAVIPMSTPASSFKPCPILTPHAVFISAVYITPQGRAPPPRSPPLPF